MNPLSAGGYRWRPDIPTLFITLLVTPILIYLIGIIRKHIKSWSGYAIDGICYWVGRSLMRSLAARFSLRRYCRIELEKENQFLFVPSRNDVKLAIDKVFVDLTLEHQASSGGMTYDQSNLFTAGNRMRVIGDPGSGKSSLVKRLFRDCCKQAIAKPSKARLPVLIELKNVDAPSSMKKEKLGDWFVKMIRDSVTKTSVYGIEECFDSYVGGSGLLVLLDGLDEVASSRYAKTEDAVIALSERLHNLGPHNVVILTMRTQLHQQVKDSFRGAFGKGLFVKPFSPSDIYEFLCRWPFPKEAIAPAIYTELTDHPTLREMCTNPLILSMYVAERQSGSNSITPESRTEFYRRVVDELLVRRRQRQKGPAPAPTKLREQRERILGRLAYEHLLDPNEQSNSLQWGRAIEIVRSVTGCSLPEAKERFKQLATETGIISEERSEESFRFIHLTFCEFLAALEAVEGQKAGVNSLLATHKDFFTQGDPTRKARLMEVVPFACGLAPRSQRPDLLSEVAELGDGRLLARCFLETKGYEHPVWDTFAESTRNNLLQATESDWNEQWLQDLHLFNVVVRDAANCSKYVPGSRVEIDLGQFYSDLLKGSGGRSLAKLLSAYASHDAVAAFRLAEISQLDLPTDFPETVIDNCDQLPFLSIVTNKFLTEPERTRLWACPLAEAGLRSRLVAGRLAELPLDRAHVRDLAAKVEPRLRWDVPSLTSKSLYSQILTLGASNNVVTQTASCYPNLLRFQQAPAPGSVSGLRLVYNKNFVPTAVVLITALLAISHLALTGRALALRDIFEKFERMPSVTISLLSITLALLTYAAMFRGESLRHYYRVMMNLSYRFHVDRNSQKVSASLFSPGESILRVMSHMSGSVIPMFLMPKERTSYERAQKGYEGNSSVKAQIDPLKPAPSRPKRLDKHGGVGRRNP